MYYIVRKKKGGGGSSNPKIAPEGFCTGLVFVRTKRVIVPSYCCLLTGVTRPFSALYRPKVEGIL